MIEDGVAAARSADRGRRHGEDAESADADVIVTSAVVPGRALPAAHSPTRSAGHMRRRRCHSTSPRRAGAIAVTDPVRSALIATTVIAGPGGRKLERRDVAFDDVRRDLEGGRREIDRLGGRGVRAGGGVDGGDGPGAAGATRESSVLGLQVGETVGLGQASRVSRSIRVPPDVGGGRGRVARGLCGGELDRGGRDAVGSRRRSRPCGSAFVAVARTSPFLTRSPSLDLDLPHEPRGRRAAGWSRSRRAPPRRDELQAVDEAIGPVAATSSVTSPTAAVEVQVGRRGSGAARQAPEGEEDGDAADEKEADDGRELPFHRTVPLHWEGSHTRAPDG